MNDLLPLLHQRGGFKARLAPLVFRRCVGLAIREGVVTENGAAQGAVEDLTQAYIEQYGNPLLLFILTNVIIPLVIKLLVEWLFEMPALNRRVLARLRKEARADYYGEKELRGEETDRDERQSSVA